MQKLKNSSMIQKRNARYAISMEIQSNCRQKSGWEIKTAAFFIGTKYTSLESLLNASQADEVAFWII